MRDKRMGERMREKTRRSLEHEKNTFLPRLHSLICIAAWVNYTLISIHEYCMSMYTPYVKLDKTSLKHNNLINCILAYILPNKNVR